MNVQWAAFNKARFRGRSIEGYALYKTKELKESISFARLLITLYLAWNSAHIHLSFILKTIKLKDHSKQRVFVKSVYV